MQRDKGARWDNAVKHRFAEAMPGARCVRGLQARGGGDNPDVDAGGVFSIECKCVKKPPVRTALAQIVEEAPKGTIPMLIVKYDRKEPFVVLQLDDFLEFVADWWRATHSG